MRVLFRLEKRQPRSYDLRGKSPWFCWYLQPVIVRSDFQFRLETVQIMCLQLDNRRELILGFKVVSSWYWQPWCWWLLAFRCWCFTIFPLDTISRSCIECRSCPYKYATLVGRLAHQTYRSDWLFLSWKRRLELPRVSKTWSSLYSLITSDPSCTV